VSTRPVVHSPLIRRAVAAATTVLAAVGLATTAGSAGAAPQPSISQVQAKLNKLTNQEDVLIARYDRVSQDLASAKQRLALVNREVARDEGHFLAMQGQVGQIASLAYEDGNMSSTAAVLTSSDPQTVLSQSAFLIHLSTSRQQQLSQVITTQGQLASAKQYARRITTAVAGLKRQLAAQKATLDKLITKQKGILSTLTAQQQAVLIGGGGGTGGTYTGTTSTQAGKAVAYAYAQLGCPYVFSATGPCSSGFDCSGLTMEAWAHAGVSIPRDSYGQATLPSVARSQLQPGDILEFAGDSHVGIYVGGGMLIDAPTYGIPVEKVSLSSSWYASNYDGAVRP
jgi:cell wall-associated NlpC family hydrolase